jgi:hypothetical protein
VIDEKLRILVATIGMILIDMKILDRLKLAIDKIVFI